jgi:tRNA pseudouridine55 synthase|uniref:tRNA pseudouridine synthase B n=1 Tax=Desulfobacca acetoxidans TaxID=60893 RepID=A0A7C3Z0B8_9BACT
MPLNGLLLIDKPAGITSFGVVRRVRRVFRVKKAGHLGTLDPFATGLLPLALGEATKLAQFLLEEPKTYLATMRLGVETDTQDLTGRVTRESDYLPPREEICRAAKALVGEIDQAPPVFSAVHHQGERLYKLARRGEGVEVPPRKVTIYRLEIVAAVLPEVTFRVECSKGTYIRTLAHDLGRALGCGAHLSALRRLAVGPFSLEEAWPLEQIEKMTHPAEGERYLIPLAHCLRGFAAVQVDPHQARRLTQGQALPWREHRPINGEKVRVVAEGNLVAVAAVRRQGAGQVLAPVRIFHTGLASGK